MIRPLAPQNEQANDSKTVADDFGEHYVSKNLIVAAAEREHSTPDALHYQSKRRGVPARMDASHAPEEKAVPCHGIADARHSQHVRGKGAKATHRNQCRDP